MKNKVLKILIPIILITMFIMPNVTAQENVFEEANIGGMISSLLQNLIDASINLPAVLGNSGAEVPLLMFILIFMFLFVIIFPTSKMIPIFKNEPKYATVFAIAMTGIVIFGTNFVRFTLSLIAFATAWMQILLIGGTIILLYLAIRWTTSKLSKTHAGFAENDSESRRRIEEARRINVGSNAMERETSLERKAQRSAYKLGKKAYKESTNVLKTLRQILIQLIEASTVKTEEGKKLIEIINKKLSLVLNIVKRERYNEIKTNKIMLRIKTGTNRLRTLITKIQKETKDLEVQESSSESGPTEKARARNEITRLNKIERISRNYLKKLIMYDQEIIIINRKIIDYETRMENGIEEAISHLYTNDADDAAKIIKQLIELEENKIGMQNNLSSYEKLTMKIENLLRKEGVEEIEEEKRLEE